MRKTVVESHEAPFRHLSVKCQPVQSKTNSEKW